jgi:hypothetical protein
MTATGFAEIANLLLDCEDAVCALKPRLCAAQAEDATVRNCPDVRLSPAYATTPLDSPHRNNAWPI